MRFVYLDYNAGAPPRPQALHAAHAAMDGAGNPSSPHAAGRAARRVIETAREAVAALAGATPEAIIFTSGGTEANAQALRGTGRPRVLVSAVEHASVAQAFDGAEIIPVDEDGIVDLDALDRLLASDSRPALVSVMAANNETGILQPVSDVAHIAHRHGALLHCDAAQAAGRIPLSIGALGADILSLSAHKLGGIAGSGALVLADPDLPLAPFLLGGGQERRRRAGTENVAGIAAFGAAAQSALDDLEGNAILGLCDIRDRIEAAIGERIAGAVVIGARAPRLANTSCLALPGLAGHIQVMALDLAGVMVGAGAACSSGAVAPSRVLK
ncbi:MAG: cysteine desulfurase, partial [Magnetospirillum sp.]